MCTFCFCIHEKVKGHYDQCAMLALLCSMQQQACFADKAAVLVDNKALFLLCTSSQEGAQYCRLFVCSKKKRRLDSVHIIVVVCAVPFSRFDLFAAVVDKNDVTDQARSIKRGVSRRIEDFFVPAWLPKMPISGRKRDFTGSPRLLFLYFLRPGCYC